MIKIVNNSKLNKLNINNFYVVIDFDKTITTNKSNNTFSLYSKSGLYPSEYLEERNKNYNYYRPVEIDPNASEEKKRKNAKKWQEASYKLLLKYKVRKSDIKKILDMNLLELRPLAIEFIKKLNNYNIPIIICSAGIGNFIIEILKMNNCYSDNIYVHSNILKFENDVIKGSIEEVVNSMNKNNIKLNEQFLKKIKEKSYSVVIGDQVSDIKMSENLPKKDSISIGFLESNVIDNRELFLKNFDVVLTENESFKAVIDLLKL